MNFSINKFCPNIVNRKDGWCGNNARFFNSKEDCANCTRPFPEEENWNKPPPKNRQDHFPENEPKETMNDIIGSNTSNITKDDILQLAHSAQFSSILDQNLTYKVPRFGGPPVIFMECVKKCREFCDISDTCSMNCTDIKCLSANVTMEFFRRKCCT